MNKPAGILLVSFFLALFCASAYAIHETMPSETQIPLPGPDAAKLYSYITKVMPYSSWRLWPGTGKLHKGTEPHGALLTTYVNDGAFEAARKKSEMEDGSIVVKENYTADRRLAALTVMYKIKGYNPEAGDWFWAKYDPAGKVEASGKVDACIACHGKKKENDYLYSGTIKK